jgi:CHAD domain-containing protein
MVADLHQRHTTARAALLDELRSDRYAQLLERLVVLARDPELTPAGRAPTGQALPTLAAMAWRRLERRAARLSRRSTDDELHRVRIAAKRARYAAETAARGLDPARGDAARTFADELGKFQDLLGRHQDAVVATEEAHAAAAAHEDDLGLVVAAGRVMEREIQAARQERRRVRRAWSRLQPKKRRRWMKP